MPETTQHRFKVIDTTSGPRIVVSPLDDRHIEGRYGVMLPFLPRPNPNREAAAFLAVRAFERGELAPLSTKIEDTLGDFRITGTARLVVETLKWEPVLQITYRRGEKKGQAVDLGSNARCMSTERHQYAMSDQAAYAALDMGRQFIHEKRVAA